jgi:hypothetical protein
LFKAFLASSVLFIAWLIKFLCLIFVIKALLACYLYVCCCLF